MGPQELLDWRTICTSRSQLCGGEAADFELGPDGVRPVPMPALVDVDATALAYREATLLKIAVVLVDVHRPFLDGVAEQRADLAVAEIAARTGLDASLISRVTAGKLLDCRRGRVELKSLIGPAPRPSVGDLVKRTIAEIIAAEDRSAPLSDDAIRVRLAERDLVMTTSAVKKFRDVQAIPGPSKRRR